ncbi:MAG TPA: right-handed parallel beta-helix repeat-containing protein, partial [Candidatus Cybelea sp.]
MQLAANHKRDGNVRLALFSNAHSPPGDMFQISSYITQNDNNTGGVTFEDIDFVFDPFTTPQTYTALHCLPEGVQNLRVNRCVFSDCPQGIWIEQGLQSTITGNTFRYTTNGNQGTSILLGNGGSEGDGGSAKKVYIDGCVFRADQGIGGSTALIIKGCDQLRMSDCDIDSYYYGIMIQPGAYGSNAVHLFFDN